MSNPVEDYLDNVEEQAETPLSHRIARAALATAGAVLATALVEKAYNRFLLGSDEEDIDTEDASEDQE